MDRDEPAATRFDVLILGGGPGGYSCALRAGDLGLRVGLVEAAGVGGTCLHRGCVPTRARLQAATVADTARRGGRRWGITASVEGVDVPALVKACDRIVDGTHQAVEHHLAGAGVTVVRGQGRVTGPRTLDVDGVRLEAGRALVLATGSEAADLPGVVPDGVHVLNSDAALTLDHVPASVTVIGGGAVGAEFSQVWHGLGAEVTLVEAAGTLMPAEDPDLGRELGRALRRRGVGIRVGAAASAVEVDGDRVHVTLASDGETAQLDSDVVLLAVGRRPRSQGLGFETAGVRLDQGFVVPRDWSRLETHQPGVFAVGDLLPPPSLARANTAFAEGLLVADAIAGRPTRAIDYRWVARISHGLVETAAVGLSEEEARRRGNVHVTRMPIGHVVKGQMLGEGGMVKVVSGDRGAILGIQLVGPHASELAGEAMLVTGFEARADDVAALVHPHPTLSELFSETHLALAGRRLHLR